MVRHICSQVSQEERISGQDACRPVLQTVCDRLLAQPCQSEVQRGSRDQGIVLDLLPVAEVSHLCLLVNLSELVVRPIFLSETKIGQMLFTAGVVSVLCKERSLHSRVTSSLTMTDPS